MKDILLLLKSVNNEFRKAAKSKDFTENFLKLSEEEKDEFLEEIIVFINTSKIITNKINYEWE